MLADGCVDENITLNPDTMVAVNSCSNNTAKTTTVLTTTGSKNESTLDIAMGNDCDFGYLRYDQSPIPSYDTVTSQASEEYGTDEN